MCTLTALWLKAHRRVQVVPKNLVVSGQIAYTFKVADSYLAVFIAPEFGAVGEMGDVIGMKYGYRGGPSKAGKEHNFLFSSLLFKNNIY